MKSLKHIYFAGFALLLVAITFASCSSTKEVVIDSLEEETALEVKSNIQEFDVAGIKVILKPSSKQVVSAKLFIDGGTANYDMEKSGVESLALTMVTQGGTLNNPKEAFFTKAERMGTEISGSTNYDYCVLSLRCLDKYWDASWELYADAILNPAFDAAEFENQKGQMLAGTQQAESDPDTHLRNITMGNTFKGMNYAKNPDGTPATVEALTLEDVKAYYESLLFKDRLAVVIVGNITKEDAIAKVTKAFSQIKSMGPPLVKEEKFKVTESSYNEENREIATNYIRGYMNAPQLGTKDEVAMRVAMSILRDRLFEEVRTKRNLSYAPAAFFPSGILNNPYLAMYVSTTKPNESIQVMLDEVRKLRKTGFGESELKNKKGEFLTQHYMAQETNASQTDELGKAALSTGWKKKEKFIDDVYGLTVDDLNNAFLRYTKAINWTYLGDTSIVDKEVFLAPIVEEGELTIVKPEPKKKKKGGKSQGF